MRKILTFLIILANVLFIQTVKAEEIEGPVLLTIAGKISKPNRGPADEFMDVFFGSQDVEFENARQFDFKTLKELGFKKLTVGYEDWPKKFEFEGPLLRDVLAAAGANGETIVVKAIDGYAPEIPLNELETYPVILALKVDGKFLGLGDRGPAWVIYPRDDFPELSDQDDSKFVWSTYYIEVK